MPRLCVHVCFDITQALAAAELRHEQRHELIPTAALTQPLATMMAFGQGLEFMSRHQAKELGENCASMRQGLNPLVFITIGGTFIVSTSLDLGLFYYQVVGQQWVLTPFLLY
jgi:hypothetical protein